MCIWIVEISFNHIAGYMVQVLYTQFCQSFTNNLTKSLNIVRVKKKYNEKV